MQLCRSLAKACAPEVRVNAVAAGVMETEWSQGFSPAKFEQAKKKAALNKISDVEDVAKTYVDLIENGSMTVSSLAGARGRTSAPFVVILLLRFFVQTSRRPHVQSSTRRSYSSGTLQEVPRNFAELAGPLLRCPLCAFAR